MAALNKVNTEKWKFAIKQSGSDVKNLVIHGRHLMKGSRILTLKKLTPKELYQILISIRTSKIILATYFETMFNTNNLD